MGKVRVKQTKDSSLPRTIPAISPEQRENEMILLAMDCAEKQMREGTASSQVITHFLKLGSIKGKIEREILEREKELVTAKTESIKSSKKSEEFYAQVIEAFGSYGSSCFDRQEEEIPDE